MTGRVCASFSGNSVIFSTTCMQASTRTQAHWLPKPSGEEEKDEAEQIEPFECRGIQHRERERERERERSESIPDARTRTDGRYERNFSDRLTFFRQTIGQTRQSGACTLELKSSSSNFVPPSLSSIERETEGGGCLMCRPKRSSKIGWS